MTFDAKQEAVSKDLAIQALSNSFLVAVYHGPDDAPSWITQSYFPEFT